MRCTPKTADAARLTPDPKPFYLSDKMQKRMPDDAAAPAMPKLDHPRSSAKVGILSLAPPARQKLRLPGPIPRRDLSNFCLNRRVMTISRWKWQTLLSL